MVAYDASSALVTKVILDYRSQDTPVSCALGLVISCQVHTTVIDRTTDGVGPTFIGESSAATNNSWHLGKLDNLRFTTNRHNNLDFIALIMASSLCPRVTCLRSFASPPRRAAVLDSRVRVPASHAYPSFTASARPTKQLCLSIDSDLKSASRPRPMISSLASSGSRHASSSTTSHPNQESPTEVLTWNRFFDLRKKRRYVNLLASVGTAGAAVAIGAPIMMQQDLDSWGAQVSGLEPLIVLPIMTFAVAAGGWLCGPSLGSLGFKMWAGRRGWNASIAEVCCFGSGQDLHQPGERDVEDTNLYRGQQKEKSFYARIRRYRADPSSSSPQNPIPDYYGEKIAGVKDYRRWLKDQRAFNLKKDKNML
nr:presequence translocated-associated motor subunit pam17, mitochondrial [Quercus suber]